MDKAGLVLFVDNSNWDCFFQLALGVRRAGWRAVRVTVADNRRAKWRARARAWLFDGTVTVTSADELFSVIELLSDEHLVDVQCVDSLLESVVEALDRLPPEQRSPQWAERARATDKAAVSSILRQHGVRVPKQMALSGTVAEDVVAALGLPVVVKSRVGSGGVGVEVVTSLERLEEIARGPAGDRFYERFVSGQALQYACFVGKNGVDAFVTYETLLRKSPLGPASALITTDDPQLAAVGEATVIALDLHGFVNVNVIRDKDGQDWVHDVNPRVWGSFLAFRQMGVDFLGCYLDWLGATPRSTIQRHARSEKAVVVFPAGLGNAFALGRSRETGDRLDWPWPYLRMLGPRYVAFECLAFALDRSGRFLLRRESLAGGAPP